METREKRAALARLLDLEELEGHLAVEEVIGDAGREVRRAEDAAARVEETETAARDAILHGEMGEIAQELESLNRTEPERSPLVTEK